MLLTALRLADFRNYATLDFAPAPGLNVFVGPNAQGKSNLLEAIAHARHRQIVSRAARRRADPRRRRRAPKIAGEARIAAGAICGCTLRSCAPRGGDAQTVRRQRRGRRRSRVFSAARGSSRSSRPTCSSSRGGPAAAAYVPQQRAGADLAGVLSRLGALHQDRRSKRPRCCAARSRPIATCSWPTTTSCAPGGGA